MAPAEIPERRYLAILSRKKTLHAFAPRAHCTLYVRQLCRRLCADCMCVFLYDVSSALDTSSLAAKFVERGGRQRKRFERYNGVTARSLFARQAKSSVSGVFAVRLLRIPRAKQIRRRKRYLPTTQITHYQFKL